MYILWIEKICNINVSVLFPVLNKICIHINMGFRMGLYQYVLVKNTMISSL